MQTSQVQSAIYNKDLSGTNQKDHKVPSGNGVNNTRRPSDYDDPFAVSYPSGLSDTEDFGILKSPSPEPNHQSENSLLTLPDALNPFDGPSYNDRNEADGACHRNDLPETQYANTNEYMAMNKVSEIQMTGAQDAVNNITGNQGPNTQPNSASFGLSNTVDDQTGQLFGLNTGNEISSLNTSIKQEYNTGHSFEAVQPSDPLAMSNHANSDQGHQFSRRQAQNQQIDVPPSSYLNDVMDNSQFQDQHSYPAELKEKLGPMLNAKDINLDPWAQVVLTCVKKEARMRGHGGPLVPGMDHDDIQKATMDHNQQEWSLGVKRPFLAIDEAKGLTTPAVLDGVAHTKVAGTRIDVLEAHQEHSNGAAGDEVLAYGGMGGPGEVKDGAGGKTIQTYQGPVTLSNEAYQTARARVAQLQQSIGGSISLTPILEDQAIQEYAGVTSTNWRMLLDPKCLSIDDNGEASTLFSHWESQQSQLFKESDCKRGKGGRQPATDPRMDPNIDPKRAKRILANRLSAARSKERQKREMEELKARHQLMFYKKEHCGKECYALSCAINQLQSETQLLEQRLNTMRNRQV